MGTLKFTVDAKLLRELGERLVGRPHIALAELIKNAYDADARHVELTFLPGLIRIADDGHGMSRSTFTERWMRVGTTAKLTDQVSPALGRSLTGSKGVGRLSAQLLATRLELRSVALSDPSSLAHDSASLDEEIHAEIHWPTAIDKAELTDVAVEFNTSDPVSLFANQSRHGTTIELTGLAGDWDADAFRALAREIWALQPPFEISADEAKAFAVTLATPVVDVQKSFDAQMSALMKIASATVAGRLLAVGEVGPRTAERFTLPSRTQSTDEDGDVNPSPPDVALETTGSIDGRGEERRASAGARQLLVSVKVSGAPRQDYVVEIPNCQIDSLDYEIRVFDLVHRQPEGIKVDAAREYLSEFGGVHLYDNGFRLPYYGPDVDWLRLELDHARRISRSQLMPDNLQVRNAMQDLPSNKRVFGTARISTSAEQRAAEAAGRRPGDALSIQITRDRLVDNLAFDQMTRAVRLSVHLYALTRAKTKATRILRRRGGVRPDSSKAIQRASDAVEALKLSLPDQAYQTLRDSIDTVADDANVRRREAKAYASLLGALATAGMTSLAYEHEVSKQRAGILGVAKRLELLAGTAPPEVAERLVGETEKLQSWVKRLTRIRSLFQPLLDEESRTAVERFSAALMAAEVTETMKVLARTTSVDAAGVPGELLLPPGSYAAWTAILQNLLTNAFRATLGRKPALVVIDGGETKGGGWLRIQDNGEGLDLAGSGRLFEPFERGDVVSEHAEILGLGGSGLGLTIVKMITDELGCTVGFVEPDPGWSTAIRIDWKD